MMRSLLRGCWEPCGLIKLFPKSFWIPLPVAAIIPGSLRKRLNSTWLQPGAGSAHSALDTPRGKRSCEIRERKASQGAANEFGVICQLCFDAPVFPFLFCSKAFLESVPAVPHSSSVSLLTGTMHPINKGLCLRTVKNTEIPKTLRLKFAAFGTGKQLHPKYCP